MYHKMITNKPTYFIDTGTIVNAGKKKMIYTAYLYIISVYIICISVYHTGTRTPLSKIPFLKLKPNLPREEQGRVWAKECNGSIFHIFRRL